MRLYRRRFREERNSEMPDDHRLFMIFFNSKTPGSSQISITLKADCSREKNIPRPIIKYEIIHTKKENFSWTINDETFS